MKAKVLHSLDNIQSRHELWTYAVDFSFRKVSKSVKMNDVTCVATVTQGVYVVLE